MRRPATILIHGKENILCFGQSDQVLTLLQIQHKRLLAEDVLPCAQGIGNQPDALGGVGRDIDHLHVG